MKDLRHHRKAMQKQVIKSMKKTKSTPSEVLKRDRQIIPFSRPKTILNKRKMG